MAEETRLWHDDVRPAPKGWVWARTNDAAKAVLDAGPVAEISLDHDLGYDGPPPGPCEECGGTGVVVVEPNPRDRLADHVRVECAACDGDGFIGGDVLYIAGTAEETGCDLVRWMIANGKVPAKVTIHSWNPAGAKHMALLLVEQGHVVLVAPYDIGMFRAVSVGDRKDGAR